VVAKLSQIDTGSWSYVSQHGDDEAVLVHLVAANIERLDLEKIAWRMRKRKFYDRVIEICRDRHVYHPTLWSYSLRHGDTDNLREYLLGRHPNAGARPDTGGTLGLKVSGVVH